MNEFLKYAAIVLFANVAFLFGLRWVTKGLSSSYKTRQAYLNLCKSD